MEKLSDSLKVPLIAEPAGPVQNEQVANQIQREQLNQQPNQQDLNSSQANNRENVQPNQQPQPPQKKEGQQQVQPQAQQLPPQQNQNDQNQQQLQQQIQAQVQQLTPDQNQNAQNQNQQQQQIQPQGQPHLPHNPENDRARPPNPVPRKINFLWKFGILLIVFAAIAYKIRPIPNPIPLPPEDDKDFKIFKEIESRSSESKFMRTAFPLRFFYSPESYLDEQLKSLPKKFTFIDLFYKIQPIFFDILHRKSDLESFILAMDSTLKKNEEFQDHEFLSKLTTKKLILMLILSLNTSERREFGLRLSSSRYPLPLMFLKGPNSYQVNLDLFEFITTLSDYPLISILNLNTQDENFNPFVKELFNKKYFPVSSYLDQCNSHLGSIDIFLGDGSCSNYSLAIVNSDFQNNFTQTILSLSALVIIKTDLDRFTELVLKNVDQDKMNFIQAQLKSPLIPKRGNQIFVVSIPQDANEIEIKENILKMNPGLKGKFILEKISQNITNFGNNIRFRNQFSQLKNLTFGLVDPYLNNDFKAHSLENFKNLYKVISFTPKSLRKEDFTNIYDPTYMFYLEALNSFKNLNNFLPLTASAIKKDPIMVYKDLFKFNSHLREIEKKNLELSKLNSLVYNSTDSGQIFVQKSEELEEEIANLTKMTKTLRVNPTILKFKDAFQSQDPIKFQKALTSVKDWVTPFRNALSSQLVNQDKNEAVDKIKENLDDKDISIESIMNEIINGAQHDPSLLPMLDNMKKFLQNQIKTHKPINLISENLAFGSQTLKEVMKEINSYLDAFVISIMGPQSSGKSTFLNYLLETAFATQEGRCTKGVYMTIFRIEALNKTLIVLDTEGLMSVNARDEQFDRQLVTFLFSVSHFVIINTNNQPGDSIAQIIGVCGYALQLFEMKHNIPKIFWTIQNMQGATGAFASHTQMNNILDLINKLDKDIRDRFEFSFDNIMTFVTPFEKCEIKCEFGDKVLLFIQQLLKAMQDKNLFLFNSPLAFYERAEENWRNILKYGDNIMKIKIYIQIGIRADAIREITTFVPELSTYFEALKKFDEFFSNSEGTLRFDAIEEQLNLCFKNAMERGKILFDEKITKNPKFSKISDFNSELYHEMVYELEKLKLSYREKYESSFHDWRKKDSIRKMNKAIENLLLNCKIVRDDDFKKKLISQNEEILAQERTLANEKIKNIETKIYDAFNKANNERVVMKFLTYKQWRLPGNLELKKEIKSEHHPVDLNTIKNDWIYHYISQTDYYASQLKRQVEDFLESFKPSNMLDESSAEQILKEMDEFYNTKCVATTDNFINYLVLKVFRFQYFKMRDQIEEEYQIQIEIQNKTFTEQLAMIDKINNGTTLKQCNFGYEIAQLYLKNYVKEDLIRVIKADIIQSLTNHLADSFLRPEYNNEYAFLKAFDSLKSKPEDYHSIIKYSLDLEKYLEEIFESDIHDKISLSLPEKIKNIEKKVKEIIETIKNLLQDIKSGKASWLGERFSIVQKIRNSPDDFKQYLRELLSKSGLQRIEIDQIVHELNLFYQKRKSESETSSYNSDIQIIKEILDMIMVKQSQNSNLISICNQEIKYLQPITYNHIFVYFKQIPILKPYEVPDFNETIIISSLESFVDGFLQKVNEFEEGELSQLPDEIKSRIIEEVDTHLHNRRPEIIGCTKKCPICGQKCSLGRNHQGDHHANVHMYGALRGHHDHHSHLAHLVFCNDHDNNNHKWGYSNDLTFQEYVKQRSNNTWKIFSEKNDVKFLKHQTNLRKAWLATKEFFLNFHQMVDSTPPEWESLLPKDQRLGRIVIIPGYTDKIDFTKMWYNGTQVNTKVKVSSNILDIVFCMDITGSMMTYLAKAKDAIQKIIDSTKLLNLDIRFGFVGYRDHLDSQLIQSKDLSIQAEITNFLSDLSASGGGDAAEAVLDGLENAVFKMNWRPGSSRYVFLIADQPAHGKEFNDYSSSRDYHYHTGCPCKIDLLTIRDGLKDRAIKLKFLSIGPSTDKMSQKFRSTFLDYEEKTLGTNFPFETSVASIVTRDLKPEDYK